MNINLDKDSIIVKTIKVGITTLIGFSLFIGFGDVENELEPITFQLNAGLSADANGYYHLTLDTTNWQTLHRISGHVYRNGDPMNVTKFAWSSNFYWALGDTFGYVIANNGLTDDLVYVGYDTTYITWFNGYEVPIVNGSSYSREDGEVNTMMAPVKSMAGDTATIYYGYQDPWSGDDTYGEFYVIFD